jgi:hypothetical protein
VNLIKSILILTYSSYLCDNIIYIMAAQDWQTLTRLTGGARFEIERIRLTEPDVAIEGRFELPPLALLPAEDQIFVAAFVRCHGSIKQMEKFFGVSYPTIKNRLNRIGALLPFAEIEPADEASAAPSTSDLLGRLERGETTVKEVLNQLQKTAQVTHE